MKEFKNVWSINSIVVIGDTLFIGTSPNGGVYKYSVGQLSKVYPAESLQGDGTEDTNEVGDSNAPEEKYLSNEHIFAMSTDVTGRLLVGISGKKCQLMRLEKGQMDVIVDMEEDKYIFAIATDQSGNIYLGTGPEGKIYKLDSFGQNKEVIYDSLDKNIMSLVIGEDGFIYAGSDSRGLIYKIDSRSKTTTVLYDSEQNEITALLFSKDGNLYAAATSAKIVKAQDKFATQLRMAGRPDDKAEKKGESNSGASLKIANTGDSSKSKPSKKKVQVRKSIEPSSMSYIYKISKDGYVTDVFHETAVFFGLARQNKQLLVGTGNSARLFTVEPDEEQEKIVYEDKQASQITAVTVLEDSVYIGTANPAKLIKLGTNLSSEGTYTSDLLDASQPAKWGKLQIEADVPEGCKIKISSRSGNVKDINDQSFSQWTKPVDISGAFQLRCPNGRFCQYKLLLQTKDGSSSPTVREIAVSSTVPNLAPKVEEIAIGRIGKPGKEGVFKINYNAVDENKDKLIYKIDFRKVGRTNWIELKDDVETGSFEWDGKTVEDGRYEIRVTADDVKSNTSETKLTGSRISDYVVVDNTGPVISRLNEFIAPANDKLRVEFGIKLADELSAVSKLEYTVDSNKDWMSSVPTDMVYDTTEEEFSIVIEDLLKAEHIVTFKATDAVGNVTYKTFEITGSGV
ncbi:MAG: hypothetical protein ACYSSI_11480 [Planctomycetota bacterium]